MIDDSDTFPHSGRCEKSEGKKREGKKKRNTLRRRRVFCSTFFTPQTIPASLRGEALPTPTSNDHDGASKRPFAFLVHLLFAFFVFLPHEKTRSSAEDTKMDSTVAASFSPFNDARFPFFFEPARRERQKAGERGGESARGERARETLPVVVEVMLLLLCSS